MTEKIKQEILEEAKKYLDVEICGVIIVVKGRERFRPCKNLADRPDYFVLDPKAYAAAEDVGDIVAIVHSHPKTNAKPTPADLKGIEATQLPWVIVNPRTDQVTYTEPTGYVMPLLGREFVHGVIDCYTLIQDYHKQKFDIDMPDFPRNDFWWDKKEDKYIEGFEQADFVRVDKLEENTCILMQIQSPVYNHAAVYLGDDVIMHHLMGRLSSRDVWGGYWRKASNNFYVRHKDLC